jgi:hypothetical protein
MIINIRPVTAYTVVDMTHIHDIIILLCKKEN